MKARFLWLGCAIAAAGATVRAGEVASAGPPSVVIPRVDRVLASNTDAGSKGASARLRIVDFRQRDPEDGTPVSEGTSAYLSYDDDHLYVVFECRDQPGGVRAHLVKREQAYDSDDWVAVLLDTFQDRRRAYAFYVNPLGVQADSILSDGQEEDFTFDTVWRSEGHLTEDGYRVSMAIPFKSLRFSAAEVQNWGIAVGRAIVRKNEVSWWPHLSRGVDGMVRQLGTLVGLRDITSGHDIQAIPYLLGSRSRFLDRSVASPAYRRQAEFRAGVDAKVVLKNAVSVDLAVNPDFSQVESDEPQVTVNQRFEVFFPEKRPFFLENADYFKTPINLLFTRRITDMRFGVRATGKLGRYSFGTLFADDRFGDLSGSDANAFFQVHRVRRDILNDSHLGGIFAERSLEGHHNRVAGVDALLRLSPLWSASFQVAASSTKREGESLSGSAIDLRVDRVGRNWTYSFEFLDRSPDFESQTGFVPRTDIRHVFNYAKYRFRHEGRRLLAWGPDVLSRRIWDHQGNLLEFSYGPAVHWEFSGQTSFGIYYLQQLEGLRPKDFSALGSHREFHYARKGLLFSTAPTSWISAGGSLEVGPGINFSPPSGQAPELVDLTAASASLALRPTTSLTIANSWLLTRLKDRGAGSVVLIDSILRSRWNYQLSRELSLRFILQYEALDTDPRRTSVEAKKGLAADFLLTYLLNPGTALHAGYADLREEVELRSNSPGRAERPWASVGRQWFVKISYLHRF